MSARKKEEKDLDYFSKQEDASVAGLGHRPVSIIPPLSLPPFPIYPSFHFSHPFPFSRPFSFFGPITLCHLSAFSFFAQEMSLRVRSTAPSWVATDTAVPESTTRTNIKPETAIRWPEYGSSPRTSPYARDACVAFKPTPKPTPYLTRGYLAPVLQFSEYHSRVFLSFSLSLA